MNFLKATLYQIIYKNHKALKRVVTILFFLLFIHACCTARQFADTTIKVVWFDDTLTINSSYLQDIPEYEKAAVAYVSLYDSRDCDWEGELNKAHDNLNCKIVAALGLGYQCSDKHLGLMKYWFRNDTSILDELKGCPMPPGGATRIYGIDKILLTRLKNGSFKVYYEASGINIRTETSWYWKETILFKKTGDSLVIVSRKQKMR